MRQGKIAVCKMREIKRRKPNPEVNIPYEFCDKHSLTYDTKVLKDPINPAIGLVDAVNIYWNYSGTFVQTPVLKHLITVIEHKNRKVMTPNYIEWKSRVEYRPDGVVDNTQVVIHIFSQGTSE